MALIEKQQHIKRRQIIFAVVCLFSLKKIVYNDKKIRGGKFVKIITLMENTQGEEGCAIKTDQYICMCRREYGRLYS